MKEYCQTLFCTFIHTWMGVEKWNGGPRIHPTPALT